MKLNRLLSKYSFAHRFLTLALTLALVLILLLVSAVPAFADYVIAQETDNNVSMNYATMGQSFTTISAGQVTQIDVHVGAMNGHTTDLRIYSGGQQPDNPAAALYVQTVSVNCDNCWFSIPLTTHLDVSAVALYTFELTNWQGRYSYTDPYSGGMAWQDGSGFSPIDFAFRVHFWAVDLALTKSVSPLSAKPGEAITYTIAFSNTGSIAATNVVLTDTLSANIADASYTNSGVALTLAPDSQYAWTAPDLLQGDGGVITITGVLTKPLAEGTLPNTVTLAASGMVKTEDAPLMVENVAPVANAGVDQSVGVSETVTLNGSGMDDNGDALTYGWVQTGGAAVTLSDATAQVATFTAPSAADVFTFTLTVTDTGLLADTDEVVVATRDPASLTVNVVGSGAVDQNPLPPYLYGDVVTLTANAATGWSFAGWSGDLNGSVNPITITMTGDKVVTATFTLNTYKLKVSKAGTGQGRVTSNPTGINCPAACSTDFKFFDYNTLVTLTVTPTTGSTFVGWNGSGCSGSGTCAVTMDAAKSVTATFNLNTYTLTVTTSGTGQGAVTSDPAGINCGVTCTASFDYNTPVTLTATPATGSAFTRWSDSGCSGAGACIVTMDAAKSVTASFTLNTYTLTVMTTGTGQGAVIAYGTDTLLLPAQIPNLAPGTVITLTAVPSTTSVFAGWSGAVVTTTNPLVLTMDADKVMTATFNLAYRLLLPTVFKN